VCQQFFALCRDIDLLVTEIVAIDGSKFKAVNAKARNYTREKLRRRLGEIDEAIARHWPNSLGSKQRPSRSKRLNTG